MRQKNKAQILPPNIPIPHIQNSLQSLQRQTRDANGVADVQAYSGSRPPDQRYFIYATDHCDVKASDMVNAQPKSRSKQCDAVDTMFQDTVPSLRMPYGGLPFHDWLVQTSKHNFE